MKHPRIITYIVLALATVLFGSCFQQAPQNQTSDIAEAIEPRRIAPHTANDLYELLSYHEGRYPLVSAHRGGPTAGFPENALETFERMANIHPVIIECDIQMTRDSVLIMLHDDHIDRTTNAKGRIADMDYAQLENVRLRDKDGTLTDYRIPTLAETLQWGAGKVVFTLDVKRGVPYQKVVDEVRANQAEAYSVIITYNANQAEEVHHLAPELMISASIRSLADLSRLNRMGIPNEVLVAFVGTSEAAPEVYEALHQEGITTILGTMGNLDTQAARQGDQRYTEMVRRGADILSTDRPLEAGNALQQLVRDDNLSSPYIR